MHIVYENATFSKPGVIASVGMILVGTEFIPTESVELTGSTSLDEKFWSSCTYRGTLRSKFLIRLVSTINSPLSSLRIIN